MLVFGGGSPVVTWKETETTQLKSLQMHIFLWEELYGSSTRNIWAGENWRARELINLNVSIKDITATQKKQ